MAAQGEIEPPEAAIFADTHWEPAAVYAHLAWLRSGVLPFPVHVVSAGDIRENIRARRNTTGGRFAAIPWHVIHPDGSTGIGRRQCSNEYKLEPIAKEIRRLLGVGRHGYIAPGAVEVLIGISWDEAHRMREPRQRYLRNLYPLVDLQMRRFDCLQWLERHGYARPPKSSCIGCPFHGDDYWREMRDNRPLEWAEAVAFDHRLRQGERGRGTEYMHRSYRPLAEADLDDNADRQLDMFGNECLGVCGV
jgi:hypothetical protein